MDAREDGVHEVGQVLVPHRCQDQAGRRDDEPEQRPHAHQRVRAVVRRPVGHCARLAARCLRTFETTKYTANSTTATITIFWNVFAYSSTMCQFSPR